MSRSLGAVSPGARVAPLHYGEVASAPSLIEAALARHEIGSLAVGADGSILEVSSAVARWLGADPSEIVGTPAWQWTTTITPATWRVYWMSFRDADPVRLSLRLKARDGTLRAVEGRLMYHVAAGQPYCAVLFEPDAKGDADTRGERDLRLEFMLTEGTDGIWDYNIPAGTVFCSPAYLAMLGLSEPPVDIDAALGLVHPDDQAQSAIERAAVFRGEKDSVEQELRLRHADGCWKWVVLRVRALSRDAEGAPLRLMGSVVDITARKEAELALRRDRDLFEALMQTSPTPMLVVDDDSKIVFANGALRRLFGVSAEAVATTWRDRSTWPLYTLDGEPAKPEALPSRQALARRAPVYDVRLFIGRGRRRKLLSCNAVPVFEDGRLACAVVAVTDITAQVAAERALEQSARDLRETLEHLPIGVAVVAPNGPITLCNPMFARMAQTKPERLIGMDLLRTDWRLADESGQLIRFPEHPVFRPWVDGSPVRGMALQGPMDADELRWVVFDLVPRRDETGALRDVVMSATDVTYRRRVEASLMEAQKVESLGRLATGIAHDFNNLLTAVLGGADLVAEMLPADLPVQVDLARIVEAAERGAALTHQLLGYARRQPVQPRVIRVAQQVRAAAEMIERVVREDVRLVVSIADPDLRVKLDPNQFDQVLLNLAVNARDAMPAGGVLSIEVDTAPRLATGVGAPLVALRVRDTGVGIAEEIRDRIFEPFFTTKSPGEGTGLGLATCFGIVAQNGGQIAVESGSGGTTFEVTLPRVDEEPEVRPKTPSLPPLSIDGTVLLVEDDDMVREMARRALSRAGLSVVEAASGEAALAIRARGVAFDAVVTDVVMPGLDGRALADALGDGGRVPVLFTSGHADNLLGERGIIRAGTNFLQKPYSAEALCQRVRALLGQRSGGAAL